jgi:isoleucyl-tRNA synthetase
VHLTRYPLAADGRDEGLRVEVDLARAIVGLGRAARNEASIGIRQPLAALTVAGELGGANLSDEIRAEVEDELNVKALKFADTVEGLARRIARPNPRVLGPKLGPQFPAVNQALQSGAYKIAADGSVHVAGHVLGPEDVTISLEPLENQTLVQNTVGGNRPTGDSAEDGREVGWRAALAVALDRQLTPELRAEGLARDLIRRVQVLRREAGLQVGQPIVLGLDLPSELRDVLEPQLARIRQEVGATDVRSTLTEACTWRGDLDGNAVAMSVEPVS